jgi:hypothetical protein
MGYHIFSFGVQLDKVGRIISSGDKAVFEAIMGTDMFDLYASQDIPGSIATKHALEHLIFNKPYHAASAHSYWYAFIAICAHVGTSFNGTHEIKFGYETDFINNYLKTDFGVDLVIEETLLNEERLFGLPRAQDWPMHGVLHKAELLLLKEKFQHIDITDDQLEELLEEDEEKEMAYDSIRQIKENILFCLDNDMQLISFCH